VLSVGDADGDDGATSSGAVRRIMRNWELFVKGDHKGLSTRESNKARKRNKFPHGEEDLEGDDNDDLGQVVY
jgi:hypothetical protein